MFWCVTTYTFTTLICICVWLSVIVFVSHHLYLYVRLMTPGQCESLLNSLADSLWLSENVFVIVSDLYLISCFCFVWSSVQCVTKSLFQFSRREFLSFNLMFETRTRISFFQSRASRRERESRLGQISREFSGITFIAFLLTDIFKKGC